MNPLATRRIIRAYTLFSTRPLIFLEASAVVHTIVLLVWFVVQLGDLVVSFRIEQHTRWSNGVALKNEFERRLIPRFCLLELRRRMRSRDFGLFCSLLCTPGRRTVMTP